MFSKVKAGFWTGVVVAALLAGLKAAGIEVSQEWAAIITTVVATILAWFKVEKVGAYKT